MTSLSTDGERRSLHPLLPNLRWRLGWYLKRTRPVAPPYYVNLEPTNACNLRCSICSMDGSRPAGLMELDLFRRLADDAAASGVTEARLFLGGEPLLHPDIAEMVRYAEGVGLVTCIHTNALRLDGDMAEALLDSGLSILSFSFDGETAEEYESIRVGGSFEEVLGNILRFLEIKKRRGMEYPETTLQIIKPGEPPITAAETWRHPGQASAPPPRSLRPEFAGLFRDLPLDHWFLLPPHEWPDEQERGGQSRGGIYFPCQALWQSLSITWDGTVVLCCGDLNGRMPIGDMQRQSILEVWNSDIMMDMRKRLLRPETPKCELCAGCNANWRHRHPLGPDFRRLLQGRLH